MKRATILIVCAYAFLAIASEGAITNRVLDLDGAGYVDVPMSTSLDLGTNLSFMVWIKPKVLPNMMIIANSYRGSYWPSYALAGHGTFQLTLGTSTASGLTATNSNAVATNVWTHLAVTYDGNIAKYYTNGYLDCVTNLGSVNPYTPIHNLFIGHEDGSAAYFNGQMDELSIWSNTLSEAQIHANMYAQLTGNEANLVAYYNFNEGVQDSTINANNGSLIGTATIVEGGIARPVISRIGMAVAVSFFSGSALAVYQPQYSSNLTDWIDFYGLIHGESYEQNFFDNINDASSRFYRLVESSESTNSTQTQTLSQATTVVDEGYYRATNLVQVDTDLTAGNIRSGVNLFGIAGTFSSGSVTTNIFSPSTTVITEGYYASTNLIQVDTDLATGNIRSGAIIFGVAGKASVVDTAAGNAAAGDILASKTAYVNGAQITGNIATRTLSANGTTVSAGYYAETDLATVEADLAATNIRSGVILFGVTGTLVTNGTVTNVIMSSQFVIAKTGVTNSLRTNDDGALQSGISWPNPRFTVQANVVIDNLTGLMWTKDAGLCTNTDWNASVAWANSLSVDGYSDWRLPSVNEAESLYDYRDDPVYYPFPSGHPFVNVKDEYWSGTTVNSDASSAWRLPYYHMEAVDIRDKTSLYNAWSVRGPISASATLVIPKTGQTVSYATGDDGDLEAGVSPTNTRFVAIGTTMIKDAFTGLIWAKTANLYSTTNWNEAVDYCATLTLGNVSDWRLPSARELRSLCDYGRSNPALPSGHPFLNVQSTNYWTGTHNGYLAPHAVELATGGSDTIVWLWEGTPTPAYVWPVRGGQ